MESEPFSRNSLAMDTLAATMKLSMISEATLWLAVLQIGHAIALDDRRRFDGTKG